MNESTWISGEVLSTVELFVIGPDDWGQMSDAVKAAINADIVALDLPGGLNITGIEYEDGVIVGVTFDPQNPLLENEER